MAIVVCGLAFVLCTRRDDYLSATPGRDSGVWAWGIPLFAIGIYACLIATLLLIVEYLARPTATKPFTLRSLVVRTLFVLSASTAIFLWMYIGYGLWQGVGAVIGTFLFLSAVREKHTARAVLAVLAIIAIGLTFMGTQSSFQFARRHADEIVAAANQFADQIPAHFGEIQPNDPLAPSVLRKLGARRIWIDQERVAVYVGGDTEFQIYRRPHPTTSCDPVWGFRGKGSTKITDRLWTNDY